MMSYIDCFQMYYLNFSLVCSCSPHLGYLLYHPCLIWDIDLAHGFLRAWCLKFTAPSVFGSQIYSVICAQS